MNALPVIERELRVAARQSRVFYYRLAFAVGGIGIAFIFFFLLDLQPFERSKWALSLLAFVCVTLCQFAGCFLTADCLSSEKREGTLGLLFLTPLRAQDIVLGKMVTHSLCVIYGLLAIFPVFFLTLLNGGVTHGEVVRLLLALLPAMLLSLAAGMYFSARHEEARAAVVATFLFMVAINLAPLVDFLAQSVIRHKYVGSGNFLPWESALSPSFNVIYAFDRIQRGPPSAKTLYWAGLVAQTGLAVLLLVMAARRVRLALGQGGEKLPKPAARFTPRTGKPPRIRDAALWQNPCYLQVRRQAGEPRWARRGRVVLLVFSAIFMPAALIQNMYEFIILTWLGMAMLHIATKFLFILETCRQIHRDRHGGALEILLCTPLEERQIRDGYVQGAAQAGWPGYRWLLIVNWVVLWFCVGFRQRLELGNSDLPIFCLIFIGGMVVAATDYQAIKWRGGYHGLTARTQTRAIFKTFIEIMAVPWVLLAIGIGMLAASRASNRGINGFLVFWFSFCVLHAVFLRWRARQALTKRFRQLAGGG